MQPVGDAKSTMLPPPSTKADLLRRYGSKLTVEDLDRLMVWVMDPSQSRVVWWASIVRLLSAVAYLYARQRILDDTWEVSRQTYEQDRVDDDRSEVNQKDPA